MAKRKPRRRPGDAELLESAALLAESAEKDGSASRIFFAGRNARSGVIPIADLLVIIIRHGLRCRDYTRFTKEWPREFKAVTRVTRLPRFLCSAPAGVLDGVLYLGTDEIRWTPIKSGEQRKPVPPGTEGCMPGATAHDLHERDLRRARSLNPVRIVWHRTLLMLGRKAYDLRACDQEEEGIEVSDHLRLPFFMTSINLPYQKFKLRRDEPDALRRAEHAIKASSEGRNVVEEAGASMLLRVLSHANEGVWLSDSYGVERAPFTGMYKLNPAGEVIGRPEVPVGYEGSAEDVGGTPCLSCVNTVSFGDPSETINNELDKFFVVRDRHVRFQPTVGKEWAFVRQNHPLWLPQHTPRKLWTPAEMAMHPQYETLCLLAALATVEKRGKLAYADMDLVVGSAAWVDLDSAPRVQLVNGFAGLCHYSNGIRCNLAHLDIEAHLRETRASSLAGKAHRS